MLQENERALEIIKINGPMAIIPLAKELGITVEGARFNLLKLAAEGLVESSTEVKGRGRPQQIWSLTKAGHSKFPAKYQEVTIKLIETIRSVFGDSGMNAVLAYSAEDLKAKYSNVLGEENDLEGRIKRLAQIRDQEGYMARYEKVEGGFLLIEDHCPICEAASACQKFCQVELQVFNELLGGNVKRTEHLFSKGRRCVYEIKEP
ncbi:helix-turn-helix transcriptional regulator [Sphingobacterium daejeonense]|uniref:helix-turn-helix transcriptional regulator n=1 Tax=Sphingobacterium daejeonense TaxID=371142 RepID=UPI0010C3CC38|nr:metalloregulator ArsR/SmtB family transcription factor [Sphingobacterium daejeonense]VTP95211.1 iron-sulfur cluster biosynthesis transcriptional regulator SufR [Sphingobacterium daejeonense]